MASAYREHIEDELARGNARSITAIVSSMLADAYACRASDIHIDPTATTTHIRLRIDGSLVEPYTIPLDAHAELVARLKILAGLRTDEHFSPQDGRFHFAPPQREAFDIRLSIIPTQHGENAVLRLLSHESHTASLPQLGMDEAQIEEVREVLACPYGLILIAGPTGSGKTTTLYALIKELGANRSIVSIEDPVEYSIPGIRQVQVMPRTGLTFAEGLRALLRQDPDVLVIGEIRDAETARIALNAAHTGHLVLSTLHANGAAGALPRLEEFGTSAVRFVSLEPLVVAQKLVRIPCETCNGAPSPNCLLCLGTGYCGRRGSFELHRYA